MLGKAWIAVLLETMQVGVLHVSDVAGRERKANPRARI